MRNRITRTHTIAQNMGNSHFAQKLQELFGDSSTRGKKHYLKTVHTFSLHCLVIVKYIFMLRSQYCV